MSTPSRSAFLLDFACVLSLPPLLSMVMPDLALASCAAIGAIGVLGVYPAILFSALRGKLLTPGLWLLGIRGKNPDGTWISASPAEDQRQRRIIALAASVTLPLATFALATDGHPVLGGLRSHESLEASAESRDRPLPWFLFSLRIPAAPGSENGETFVARLPYARGIPKHFIPSVEFRVPDGSLRLVVDAPRRPENWPTLWDPLRDSEKIRQCFSEDSRWILDCMPVRERMVEHARSRFVSALGTAAASAGVRATETGAWENPMVSGILVRFRSSSGEAEFRAALSKEGEIQGWLVFVKADANESLRAEASRLMLDLSRTATPFRELQTSRAWLDHEIAKIRIPAKIGAAPDAASDSTSGAAPGSGDENPDANATQDGRSQGEGLRRELDALSIVQLALLSKLSVEPSSFDGFFHLAGTSFLKWRISRRLGLPRHAAASRALVESSSRYLADLNAMDPRTRQIEALLLRMKALQD